MSKKKKRILLNIEIPGKLRDQYREACKKTYTNFRMPLLKAINDKIKEVSQ